MTICSKSQQKVAFTAAAVSGPDLFNRAAHLDEDLIEAVNWVAARPAAEASA